MMPPEELEARTGTTEAAASAGPSIARRKYETSYHDEGAIYIRAVGNGEWLIRTAWDGDRG